MANITFIRDEPVIQPIQKVVLEVSLVEFRLIRNAVIQANFFSHTGTALEHKLRSITEV